MEKFWDAVAKILPILTFYPGWAKAIFLTTFACFLVSVFVFITLYPAATRQQKAVEVATTVEEPPSDVRISIEQTDGTLTKLYADLGAGLTDLYSSATSLRLHTLDYTTARPDVQQYMSDPLPPNLRADAVEVIGAIDRVRAALVAINQNSMAAEAWNKAAQVHKADALAGLKTQLTSVGFSAREASIPITDIPYLVQFLSIASQRLRAFDFASVLTAVLATNSADIKGVGKGYDNAALRSLIFTGNLIFAFVPGAQTAGGRHALVVSFGSAMLLDVYKCIPDAPTLRDVLKNKYTRYSKYLDTYQVGLKSERFISSDLSQAMSELEQRKDLLFLELPS